MGSVWECGWVGGGWGWVLWVSVDGWMGECGWLDGGCG